MKFSDWVLTQLELRAEVSVRLGKADDGTASIMTWSDKTPGVWFWDVVDDRVAMVQFIGVDED